MELNKAEYYKKEFSKLVEMADSEGFYLDINLFKKSETRINIDKTNSDIGKEFDSGIKIRLWDGEKFLEEGTSSKDIDSLKEIIIELIARGKENQGTNEKLLLDEKIINKNFLKNSKDNLGLEKKVKKLKELRDKILKIDENVINARTLLVEEIEENIFVNPFKQLFQKIPLKILVMVAFINSDDGVMRNSYKAFTSNEFDIFEKGKKEFAEFKDLTLNMKKAKKLKGGKYKAVLNPKLTGLLAHESFGHGMEADTMMKGRALASEWIGKKIANSNVNIIDFPHIDGKNGEFYFDHEGNIAEKTYLVKNGIINEPMADIYSKTKLKLKGSRNSRFESFDHKHYTRMSNTYFEPGNEKVEDLIAKVDDGILIISSGGGMEDPKGWGVQIQGNFGQRIKDGKLIDEFYDGFALTGFLPDLMKNISGISKEFEIEGAGSCGKGHKEWVRVSEGGPYLLIDEVILG